MKNSHLFLLAASCALAGTLFGVPSNTTFARDALKRYVDSGELPGGISVFYKNGVEEIACLGYSDVAKKRAITMNDVYMQCSQTKGFCGVSIAMLVEEGKITLDDPVAKYIPAFKELWIVSNNKDGTRTLRRAQNVLKIRNVLNHTGGFPFELPNFHAMGGWSRRMPLQSVAIMAAAQPIMFEPGTREAYSNVGIDIGAAVVEVVTGMRWEKFLQTRLFDPLGMTSSTFWPTAKQLETKVEMYRPQKNRPAIHRDFDVAMQPPFGDDRVFPSAGAGLWTTAADQLKFYKMLMNLGLGENGKRILKEETVKSILAVSTRAPNQGGYSLGLAAPKRDGENEWFGHGGAWGTNCMVNWHKKQLKLWVQQITGGPQPWGGAREQAANAFFNAKIDNANANAYTGRMK